MRVIAGDVKGRRLKTPKDDRVRPTEDRIKENIFNLLFGPFYGTTVLDLFAGTGHMGIEFLSRGADFCWFCDNHPDSLRLIHDNLSLTGYMNKSEIVNGSFEKCLNLAKERDVQFDYVYIDPPYDQKAYYDEAVTIIAQKKLLSTGGRIIMEAPDRYEFSEYEHLTLLRKKTYGKKNIWIYESCD